MTYGRENVVCAMSIVALPNFIGMNGTDIAATKSSIIETPVTISGFIMGTFVTDITAVLR